jgi:hypothetical protein
MTAANAIQSGFMQATQALRAVHHRDQAINDFACDARDLAAKGWSRRRTSSGRRQAIVDFFTPAASRKTNARHGHGFVPRAPSQRRFPDVCQIIGLNLIRRRAATRR